MNAIGLREPLFDSYLFRALRVVARGEVRASTDAGELRYRSEPISARMADALRNLDHQGYLLWHADPLRANWVTADLTLTGTQLLGSWLLWASHEPTAA